MGWLAESAAIIGFVAFACLLIPVVYLFARRRRLSNRGGVFDCALSLNTTKPGAGWAAGIGRYQGDTLEWYRTFSAALRPYLVLVRDHTEAVGRRLPDANEAEALFRDQEIVKLESTETTPPKVWELAMSPASLTGLLSWLEAAPPGGGRYPGGE